ncbi:Uncharacterised protein [Enterobacter cloacae]|nr:Uncharacterised protein [Enterobacter cloacae]
MLIIPADLRAGIWLPALRTCGNAPGIIAIRRVIPRHVMAQRVAVTQVIVKSMIGIERYAEREIKLSIVIFVFLLVMRFTPGQGYAKVLPATYIKVVARRDAAGRGG